MLLAFDEVQSGIARTGKLFSHEWCGVTPDIMSLTKGWEEDFNSFLVVDKLAKCIGYGSQGPLWRKPTSLFSGASSLERSIKEKIFVKGSK